MTSKTPRISRKPSTVLLCVAGALAAIAALGASDAETPFGASDRLRPAADFAGIEGDAERSVALFVEAGKVLQHPRCLNCHPSGGGGPLQGEDGRPHEPPVARGPAGFGVAAMHCNTCHFRANFDPGGVPGDPHWHLAPIEAGWVGKSLTEICEQLKDPDRNGGRTLDAIVEHMAEDSLVGWAWDPGAGRIPAPGSQKVFGELIRIWVETGAACPPSD